MRGKSQILLNCEQLETSFALVRDGRLEEYEIERRDEDDLLAGSIYLGRVTHLEPKLEAAFVDIGAQKNAFLHYKDMLPASYDMLDDIRNAETVESGRKNRKKNSGVLGRVADKIRGLVGKTNKSKRLKEFETKLHSGRITVSDIPKMFPEGSELLVQINKGPIGTKGARLTTNITIPGRYLVLLPYSDHIGLSSRIDDRKERDRLRKILTKLELPEGMGLICRTIGEGKTESAFKSDLQMLLNIWAHADASLGDDTDAPTIVYREPDMIERTVRDFLTDDIDEIVLDSESALEQLKGHIARLSNSKLKTKLTLNNKATPLFERYNIADQITGIFNRIAQLPSGGYICIDETEALVAVDVNSGRNKSAKDQPENILKTNLEAAKEIARQVRLRNVGGLVVIDFIDMRLQRDRDAVQKAMAQYVENDRAKTRCLPISRFGLMEMTRQREHESVKDAVYDLCPYCGGSGRIKSAVSMSVEIQRRLRELLKKKQRNRNFSIRVIMHPSVLARLKNEDSDLLKELEETYGKDLSFRADPTMHMETFKLVNPDNNEELN